MVVVVNAGDEILVPLYESGTKASTVQWSQNLSQRTAQYASVICDNMSTGEQVTLFIAAEYYKDSTIANANHISKIAEKIEGEGYKLKIDGRIQYGQKNAAGELRFIVYHDKERKPFQHRFVETAMASAAAGKASEIAKTLGGATGTAAEMAATVAKNFVGDYLRTF